MEDKAELADKVVMALSVLSVMAVSGIVGWLMVGAHYEWIRANWVAVGQPSGMIVH